MVISYRIKGGVIRQGRLLDEAIHAEGPKATGMHVHA